MASKLLGSQQEAINTIILNTLGDLSPKEFSPTKLPLNTHLQEQLGYDSLDSIELVMKLEAHFNIAINDENFEETINTVGDVSQYIDDAINR